MKADIELTDQQLERILEKSETIRVLEFVVWPYLHGRAEIDVTDEQLKELLVLTTDEDLHSVYWQLRGVWMTGGKPAVLPDYPEGRKAPCP
jgi:hypothetical protein